MRAMLGHVMATIFLFSNMVATQAIAQDDFVFWPNANYDPAIPTVEDVLGYRAGDRITWHADDLLASGYIWDEKRRQLAYKPFAVAQKTDRGYVVGFTQNPNVRAYLDGLNVIFMNAIFRGAAHARPVR